MQVEPSRLVELAATSESLLDAMVADWTAAVADLSAACVTIGDNPGTENVAAAYADALGDAGEVVSALAGSLRLGVEALVGAAHDAIGADDTAADELRRVSQQVGGQEFGRMPGRGGR